MQNKRIIEIHALILHKSMLLQVIHFEQEAKARCAACGSFPARHCKIAILRL